MSRTGKRKRVTASASNPNSARPKTARLCKNEPGAGPGPSALLSQRRAARKCLDYQNVDSDTPEAHGGSQDDAECDPLDLKSEVSSALTPPPDDDDPRLPELSTTPSTREPIWRKPLHRAATLDLIATINAMPDKADVEFRDFMARRFGRVRESWESYSDGPGRRHVDWSHNHRDVRRIRPPRVLRLPQEDLRRWSSPCWAGGSGAGHGRSCARVDLSRPRGGGRVPHCSGQRLPPSYQRLPLPLAPHHIIWADSEHRWWPPLTHCRP